jgi:diguanylate cyclase (GGDEF)-like protein/PAS domain S-box-containing protein
VIFEHATLLLVLAATGVAGALISPLMRFRRRSFGAGFLHTLEQQAATLAEQAELLDLAHDAILVWDLHSGEIRFWNRGAQELYGWTAAEVIGRTPQAILQTRFPQPLANINTELVRSGRWEGELVHTRRDGTAVTVASRWALKRDRHGKPSGVLGINSDITRRKQTEAALEHLALHDALTGLPNRALFRDRLSRALSRADRTGGCVGVLFLDLDNFKLINDSLGHEAGDKLLKTVANRLQSCLRESDTVARLGGDEFTFLLEDLQHSSDAERIAGRIAEVLGAPVDLDDHVVFVSASIGAAVSTSRERQPESLLRDADVAMYRAKAVGKAGYALFDPAMNQPNVHRLELETDLRNALEQGQLCLHYQPILSLVDKRIVEVEALLRWDRPGHGLVSPATFIPVAEETGLIVPIGRWVMQEACRQAQAWNMQRPADSPLVMSINLSARQLQDPGLLADITSAARSAGLDLRALKLEITETAAMRDMETSVTRLEALKALGVQLAIDDFGTGYSSLNYLKRFPVDTLKVDRSFIERLEREPDVAIVQSVVTLAKALHLDVVGEGIETTMQVAQLRALGCDRGQGYLFARPQPAENITALLGREATEMSRAA